MTRNEIVDILARERRVERIVQNTAHAHALSQDLRDLCQMVYTYILTYDESKVVDLWESDALGYFIARIVVNQYRSANSAFHRRIRHPMATPVGLEMPETAQPR
ncbi:MAG: hypothetical protein K6A62_04630 [Bacteroidales bacterium]|nr:hypothetical protein [Bacteroidales bacterium]